MSDPKCNAWEAVQRAQSIVGKGGQYILGTGDYKPKDIHGVVTDLPWTNYWKRTSPWFNIPGSDCAGFAICWAWKLQRHRPGFNHGAWATVSDDINCNSAMEDGLHKQELFTTLAEGSHILPGDLLLYPTFSIPVDGKSKEFIGHVGMVELIPPDFKYGEWSKLTIIQCHGPNGRGPAVVRTNGGTWTKHDSLWSKPEHRTRVVRPKERL